MPNLTDQTLNLLVQHDIDLLRMDAAMQRQIIGMLNGLSAQLRKRIIKIDPVAVDNPVFQNKRLNHLAMVANNDIKTAYEQIQAFSAAELGDIAVLEGATVSDTLKRAVRVDLASQQVHASTLKALAGNVIVEGAPFKEWWSNQTKWLQDNFKREIREGILGGETIQDMVKRVHGSRAAKFKDGIMQTSRNSAKRLVRSSVLAVANEARYQTYQQNSDVIKGLQWVSTLDNRTCFVAGTHILTDNKYKLIETINAGDLIYTKDGDFESVIATKKSTSWQLIELELENGIIIKCTPEHLFLTKNAGWVEAQDLEEWHDLYDM